MTTDHRDNGNDPQAVRPGDACPNCGEGDVDRLVWIDDYRVRCSRCGTTYEPGRAPDK
jgi:uncharacterized protein (DUF983 family)